jgi:hypothetical protein
VTIFQIKSTIILCKLAEIIFFTVPVQNEIIFNFFPKGAISEHEEESLHSPVYLLAETDQMTTLSVVSSPATWLLSAVPPAI